MTFKQKILKFIYPFLLKIGKVKKNLFFTNNEAKKPITSFYNLKATTNTGKEFLFEQLKGKNVLIVNTASNCGYTQQYEALQKLWESKNNSLVIIGFPANDFKNQESGSDEEIASFCKINYGVSFPIMHKSSVIKGEQQNEVFTWLTNASQNGWNDKQPVWNFCKYLINKNGELTHYFTQTISPLDNVVVKNII